jgi:hypothetical protein
VLPSNFISRSDFTVQHPGRSDAIWLKLRVAGAVEIAIVLQLPSLVSQPRQHAALDGGEVGAGQGVTWRSAGHAARYVAGDR